MWEREKPNMIDQKFYSNDMITTVTAEDQGNSRIRKILLATVV
jgi:hypothetical protein